MNRRRTVPGYRVVPYPMLQHQMIDWLGLMHRQHTVHALLELDVTGARRAIREHRARTGEALSFTAFIVACFARAVGEDPRMHAYRKGRRRLVLFDDVDVTVLVESDVEGARIPVPHIVHAANRKTPAEITSEIADARSGEVPYGAARRWLPAWLLLPGPVRELFWARLLADPHRRKRLSGTVAVTAVGMFFGRGTGWAIPQASHSLVLSIGGVARKPGVTGSGGDGSGGARAGERVEVREYLCLTMSFDHDVIDGAPAARFGARLRELIEGGAGLDEPGAGSTPG